MFYSWKLCLDECVNQGYTVFGYHKNSSQQQCEKNEFYVLKCDIHIDIGILYVVLC